jgi:hypothetical protein
MTPPPSRDRLGNRVSTTVMTGRARLPLRGGLRPASALVPLDHTVEGDLARVRTRITNKATSIISDDKRTAPREDKP